MFLICNFVQQFWVPADNRNGCEFHIHELTFHIHELTLPLQNKNPDTDFVSVQQILTKVHHMLLLAVYYVSPDMFLGTTDIF